MCFSGDLIEGIAAVVELPHHEVKIPGLLVSGLEAGNDLPEEDFLALICDACIVVLVLFILCMLHIFQ